MNDEEWHEKRRKRAWRRKSARLNVLHELRIEIREAHEFRLIQVHHKQLVRGSQVRLLRGELLVEVTHVLTMLLEKKKKRTQRMSQLMDHGHFSWRIRANVIISFARASGLRSLA